MRIARHLAALTLLSAFLPEAAVSQHGGSCNCGRNTAVHPTWQLEGLTPLGQAVVGSGFQRWNYYVDPFNWTAGNNLVGPSNGVNEIFFSDSLFAFLNYGFVWSTGIYGEAWLRPTSAFGNPPFNECPKPGGTSCGVFQETDVLLNAEFVLGWTDSPPNFAGTGPAYIPATVVHELGHALGQHHNFSNLATMNYVKDIGGQFVFVADAIAARQNYSTRVVNVSDAATFPFRFVNGAGPDYNQPSTVTFSPTAVAAGTPFTIRDVTVEVPGNLTLNNMTLRFYLSLDRTITTSDIHIGGAVFQPAVGGSWWETTGWPVTVPVSTAPGNYYVGAIVFYNGTAQDSVAYNNSWSTEQRVQITPAAPPEPCVPNGTTLCLNQGRFRIRVDWRTPQGQAGFGQAIPYTTDSGFFWFFNNSNLEMMIKVLNGCSINSRYWAFHAATTNVEYTLTVTDSVTGAVKVYFNPLGQPAATILDTQAFATCGAAAPEPSGEAQVTALAALSGDPLERESVPVLDPVIAARLSSLIDVSEGTAGSRLLSPAEFRDLRAEISESGAPDVSGATLACTNQPQALCLNNSRFLVTVNWRTPQGQTGQGQAIPYTSDSGFFWFFNNANLEMMIKVLNGCTINSRYWAFHAATTNVEYTLTVTDTQTGQVRTYFNPLNRPAATVLDTTAFATCP